VNTRACPGRQTCSVGKETHRGKSQTPCSLDGRAEGNRSSEAHRRSAQPVTAVLQPVKVRSRRPPWGPCSNTRLAGRVTFPRESSGRKSSAAGGKSPGRIGPGGRATTRAVAQRTRTASRDGPRPQPMSGRWRSRLTVLLRKAMGAGTHRGYGPASPPGVEVTARVDGVLTQSREGLGGSPDQVVGRRPPV
jgi:hypothetical protein